VLFRSLKDTGATPFDDNKVLVSRRVGGHAYLDEVPLDEVP